MSKINMFKIEAYRNGYDCYWELLPDEIQNEIFREEHKMKFQESLEGCYTDSIKTICCNYCSIPCSYKNICRLCTDFVFCKDCNELIFDKNKNDKKNERFYGNYRYYPVCRFCIVEGQCDDYYFGDFNIKKNNNIILKKIHL